MKEKRKWGETVAAIILAVMILGLVAFGYLAYIFYTTMLELMNAVIKAY
jgi:ABC-type dipeptide/oligopeptide/nickel transport system permease component